MEEGQEEKGGGGAWPAGSWVKHGLFGRGRIVNLEGDTYTILFKGGETKRVAVSYPGLVLEEPCGEIETERIKTAIREVLGDFGWLDVELEMGQRWIGGTLRLIPGKEGIQPKEVPIEIFFKKIIGIREKLRLMEQKINNHPGLSLEDKYELEGYLTRCYGSLTTFNVLFAAKESQFRGQGGKD